jgi:type II secretory pathway component PulF
MSQDTVTGSPVRLAVLLVSLVLHAVCGVALLWMLLGLVPQFQKIFKDFGMALPDNTIMVINLSRLFGRWWFLLVPGLAAGDIGIMLALHGTGRTRLMTAWGILVWLAALLLMGMIVAAVVVPMDQPIIHLSGGK